MAGLMHGNRCSNKKYHYVYKIINTLNNFEYIGVHSTNNLNDNYLGSGRLLSEEKKLYGKDVFKLYILHHFTNRRDAIIYESKLLTFDYVSQPHVYNLYACTRI